MSSWFSAPKLKEMTAWVRRHVKQIDALLYPVVLDDSARFAEIDFDDDPTGKKPKDNEYHYYSKKAELQFWRFDLERSQATTRTALQWLEDNRLVPNEKAE